MSAVQDLSDLRLAVLIDADNVSYKYVKEMMEEVARYGTPTIKRIYGDWTQSTASGWKKVLLENAITPIQQYRYTTGKNATDSAMIIDAMDILFEDKVDGFCIVASDSDYTRLALRLRESGKKVLGIGEKKTPQPFIAACDKFIYLEIIAKHAEPEEKKEKEEKTSGKKKPAAKKQEPKVSKLDRKFVKLLRTSVEDVADENGWAFLGDVGNMLLKKQPSFDSRNYGFSKLCPLIRSTGLFEIDQRDTNNRQIKHIYIRAKQ
ncbi:MAG: NYN domain-containing protein [Clostridia bacterium]